MDAMYKEIYCKKALDDVGVLGTRFWTRHCFDPYINCEFNCVYCNTGIQNSGGEKHSANVYVKVNSAEVLASELKELRRKGVVNMGAATDIYQPAEKKYRVTRRILEVLKEHNCPFAIGTKSDLILRDLDLISEASQKVWCCVSLSITTLDEELAKLLEPNAPSPKKRLETLKKLSDEGITTGIWLTPIIPYVTDSEENIANVIENAVKNGAQFVLGGALDMRNAAGFRNFLVKNFPELILKFEKLYIWDSEPLPYYPIDGYLYNLYRKFISICQRYKVNNYIPHFHKTKQALLFYIRNFFQFEGTPTFELTQILNYLPPFKEFLQTVRIRSRRSEISTGLLETFRYFPH